jgi:PAS domain S-box-containing protein
VTVFMQDRSLTYTWISNAHLGRSPEEIVGHGDDQLMPPVARPVIAALKQSVIDTGELARSQVRMPLGEKEFWYDVAVEPHYAGNGEIVGIIGSKVDITQLKEQEARIRMLLREVTHRSKNLLSVVQGIARQSAANSGSIDELIEGFSARLQALAQSHDLLVQSNWAGASMSELVSSQLGHYAELIGSRIEVGGPPLHVGADGAQHIGMALHELATNAAKYGALSVPEGRVRVSWWVCSDATGAKRCTLDWHEQGGPPVEPPARPGFGLVVLKRVTGSAVGGTVQLDFGPDGLHWTLDFPTERGASQTAPARSG